MHCYKSTRRHKQCKDTNKVKGDKHECCLSSLAVRTCAVSTSNGEPTCPIVCYVKKALCKLPTKASNCLCLYGWPDSERNSDCCYLQIPRPIYCKNSARPSWPGQVMGHTISSVSCIWMGRIRFLHERDLKHCLNFSFSIVYSKMAGHLFTLTKGFETLLTFVRSSPVCVWMSRVSFSFSLKAWGRCLLL